MSYNVGGIIEADADYNTLVNLTTEVLGDLFATSDSDDATYGYGATPLALTILSGDQVFASDWNNLVEDINTVTTHQGATLPSYLQEILDNNLTTGEIIELIGDGRDLLNYVYSLRNNRFTVDFTEGTVDEKFATSYSDVWDAQLEKQFVVSFDTYNEARNFFNGGGEVRFSVSMDETPLNSADASTTNIWKNLIDSIASDGEIRFLYSGVGSTESNVLELGFYELSTTDTLTYIKQSSQNYGAENFTVSIEASQISNPSAAIDITFTLTYSSNLIEDGSFTNTQENTSVGGVQYINISLFEPTVVPSSKYPSITNVAYLNDWDISDPVSELGEEIIIFGVIKRFDFCTTTLDGSGNNESCFVVSSINTTVREGSPFKFDWELTVNPGGEYWLSLDRNEETNTGITSYLLQQTGVGTVDPAYTQVSNPNLIYVKSLTDSDPGQYEVSVQARGIRNGVDVESNVEVMSAPLPEQYRVRLDLDTPIVNVQEPDPGVVNNNQAASVKSLVEVDILEGVPSYYWDLYIDPASSLANIISVNDVDNEPSDSIGVDLGTSESLRVEVETQSSISGDINFDLIGELTDGADRGNVASFTAPVTHTRIQGTYVSLTSFGYFYEASSRNSLPSNVTIDISATLTDGVWEAYGTESSITLPDSGSWVVIGEDGTYDPSNYQLRILTERVGDTRGSTVSNEASSWVDMGDGVSGLSYQYQIAQNPPNTANSTLISEYVATIQFREKSSGTLLDSKDIVIRVTSES